MSEFGLSLDLEQCRHRQRRLASLLIEHNLDLALLVRPEHVQYFSGFRPAPYLQAAIAVQADGRTVLIAPNQVPEHCAADDIRPYTAQQCCTLRQDQLRAVLSELETCFTKRFSTMRLAAEGSINALAGCFGREPSRRNVLFDIEPLLWTLRRCKHSDELQLIRRAVDCTQAMYHKAREIIRPGISEIDVYCELYTEATKSAGEPLTAFGNDFQCNSPGGHPRSRPVQEGELYILDLGPAYRGYFADLCRTFLVSGAPTEEQYHAWTILCDLLDWVEQTVRPDLSAGQLFTDAKQILDAVRPGSFFHHLGHGIGLFPHEAPHLNDCWSDTFQVGDVFTVEPGLYGPDLRGGIRLEQDYLVTESGVERLSTFPLDL